MVRLPCGLLADDVLVAVHGVGFRESTQAGAEPQTPSPGTHRPVGRGRRGIGVKGPPLRQTGALCTTWSNTTHLKGPRACWGAVLGEGLPAGTNRTGLAARSEEHTSELQSQSNLVCR